MTTEYIQSVARVYAEAQKYCMNVAIAALATRIAHKNATGRKVAYPQLAAAIGYKPPVSWFYGDIKRAMKNPTSVREAKAAAYRVREFAETTLRDVFTPPRFVDATMEDLYIRVLKLARTGDKEVLQRRRQRAVVAVRVAFSVLCRVSPRRYSYPEIARALQYGRNHIAPSHTAAMEAESRYWDESLKIVGRDIARSIVHTIVVEYGWRKEYDIARVLQIRKRQAAQQDRSKLVELRV